MPPTFEADAADRTIACVRRRSRSLAAGRPREPLVQVAPSRPPPSVARHDRSANSQEFGVMDMIPSFGPPRFAGWTAAILLASVTTAFADCGDLLQRFNQALERRSLAEVTGLEKQIAADAACANRL